MEVQKPSNSETKVYIALRCDIGLYSFLNITSFFVPVAKNSAKKQANLFIIPACKYFTLRVKEIMCL
jgi:hypothetical protein